MTFLEKEFQRFDYMINPYHIQPGLLLDVDICSIKRKKATLDGMANVLNEFLHGVSKGFQDAAFASFSRRRSTVREDIAQSLRAYPARGRRRSGRFGRLPCDAQCRAFGARACRGHRRRGSAQEGRKAEGRRRRGSQEGRTETRPQATLQG